MLLKAATIQLSHILQEESKHLWKQQYHRQWPVMSRYLDPEKDVDWIACLCLRYRQEKEKRLAKKGKQKVKLNFCKYEKIEAIVKRIAVVQQQIGFENTLGSRKREVLRSLEDKELAAEFSRWIDLLREGTPFLNGYLSTAVTLISLEMKAPGCWRPMKRFGTHKHSVPGLHYTE